MRDETPRAPRWRLRRGIVGATLIASAFMGSIASADGWQSQAAQHDATLLLNPIFSDHAVLQRNQPIRFWGQAAPRSTVAVTFAGESQNVRAQDDGSWRAEFAARDAATGLRLEARDQSGGSTSIEDISIGDVFLCSGQSNMVHPVSRALNPTREMRKAADRNIRILKIEQTAAAQPQRLLPAGTVWVVPDADIVREFAAVCMFFGRHVATTMNVPVGLIHAAWGGSQIEAWIDAAGLKPFTTFDAALDLLATFGKDKAAGYALAGKQWEDWWRRTVSTSELPWTKTVAQVQALQAAPAEPGDWKTFDDPSARQHNGMVWFYRTVEISAGQAAQVQQIRLGSIGEIGSTWINGTFLGSSGGGEKSVFDIPRGVLQAGTNVIAISAYNSNPNVPAGLLGPANAMALTMAGSSSIALDSGWRYDLVRQRRVEPPRVPWEGRLGYTSIYNAMIAPLGPLPLAGVLWYQGESNATTHADNYKRLLQTLMSQWRAQLRADMPFIIIQIANYGRLSSWPDDDGWPRVREAQRQVALEDPRAAVVVTVDVGEKYDIHPPNKQIVAARAFRAARKVIYGENLASSGPIPVSAALQGNQVVIPFTDVSGQLMSASFHRPFPFMICADGMTTCSYADARLDGNTVAVDVPTGVQAGWVRYCWGQAPICNLFDAEQQPAGPFEIRITR